ncbi:hypothetical protein DS843_15545 [Roseomonas genomospecies 6]|uniref:Uncharacterized protein n=1 Tax=Roseomonas genomospecies 6 TaxID=214106 RepID=A0A9W7NIN4_9PROT|nr:hypothetical protein DS843_15545 [Roseomonas genomospecies 6]
MDAPVPNHADLACLRELERKVLWLASWTVHNANHVRPNQDGLKIGGRAPRGGVGAVGNRPAAAPSSGWRRRAGYP